MTDDKSTDMKSGDTGSGDTGSGETEYNLENINDKINNNGFVILIYFGFICFLKVNCYTQLHPTW